jgi:hypothetical protein
MRPGSYAQPSPGPAHEPEAYDRPPQRGNKGAWRVGVLPCPPGPLTLCWLARRRRVGAAVRRRSTPLHDRVRRSGCQLLDRALDRLADPQVRPQRPPVRHHRDPGRPLHLTADPLPALRQSSKRSTAPACALALPNSAAGQGPQRHSVTGTRRRQRASNRRSVLSSEAIGCPRTYWVVLHRHCLPSCTTC